jgi:BioD-like phosphotransacetylase family protein
MGYHRRGMGPLYIAGVGPRCGKTALVAGLIVTLHRRGKTAIALKPFASTPDHDADNPFFRRLLPEQAAPVGLPLPLEVATSPSALQALRPLLGRRQTVLLEGTDVLAPLGGRGTADLVAEIGAGVVLVVPYHPTHVGGQVERALPLFGDRLVGVVINRVWRYQGHRARAHVVPTVEKMGVRVVGLIPEDRFMAAPTVAEVARCVEGEVLLFPEKGEEVVEAFMVGGWPLDEGEGVFSRVERKGVVVRADRPDLHLAAMATSTVCLVLTGGLEPLPYTLYTAEEKGIPLVWTRLPTLEALERLERVASSTAAQVPGKAHRFADLLTRHADPAFLASLLEA